MQCLFLEFLVQRTDSLKKPEVFYSTSQGRRLKKSELCSHRYLPFHVELPHFIPLSDRDKSSSTHMSQEPAAEEVKFPRQSTNLYTWGNNTVTRPGLQNRKCTLALCCLA